MKQFVGVEGCLYSKGSACQSRWIEQLMYFKQEAVRNCLLSAEVCKTQCLDSKASVMVLVRSSKGVERAHYCLSFSCDISRERWKCY